MMVAAINKPYSLLITDDDAELRDALRTCFEPQGYDMHLAACGVEAIRVVRRHHIHVAILDMQMPDLSGIETMARIRAETRAAIPYLLMSGDTSQELLVKALAAEAYSLMPKPVNVGLMRELIEEIILHYYS